MTRQDHARFIMQDFHYLINKYLKKKRDKIWHESNLCSGKIMPDSCTKFVLARSYKILLYILSIQAMKKWDSRIFTFNYRYGKTLLL